MSIHPLQWPERPTRGQTILLIGQRWNSSSREQLRLLESDGCLVYLVEAPEELQPRWFVDIVELRVMLAASSTPEMVQAILERLNRLARADDYGMLTGIAR